MIRKKNSFDKTNTPNLPQLFPNYPLVHCSEAPRLGLRIDICVLAKGIYERFTTKREHRLKRATKGINM